MSKFTEKFMNDYLPVKDAPFFDDLKEMLCPGMTSPKLPLEKDPSDLAIHCPGVIRGVENILRLNGRNIVRNTENENKHDEKEEKQKDKDIMSKAERVISDNMRNILGCLGITEIAEPAGKKALATLQIAAMYHDIGKKIRAANHPRLGFNLLRHSNSDARAKMLEKLVMEDTEDSKSNEHRFSLICSIVDHHDKFGVVSTGEGSLAIFSDILYFRSDKNAIEGIRKNITSVMLINLADIASVCLKENKEEKKAAQETVFGLLENSGVDNSEAFVKLKKIWEDEHKKLFMCLSFEKITNILDDWDILIKSTDSVDGDRTKLREHLMRLDQNPYRTMKRLIRLIKESCETTGCKPLLKYVTETDVESTLISFFGSHQFQDFCTKFAYIVKMDYGLKFFKGIVCACARKVTGTIPEGKDGWVEFNDGEKEKLEEKPESQKEIKEIVENISTIFIKVISEIIRRYNPMLEQKVENAYRFGLQMRNLTDDENVRKQIIDYLCSDDKKLQHVALTWIADEVTFWSMD